MVSGIIGLGPGPAGNAHAAEPRSQADFCILPFTLCSAISRRRPSFFAKRRKCIRAPSCCSCVGRRFVFCKPVSADRCGMAASKFLGSAAASVILLCSATGRKSYGMAAYGCIEVAMIICRLFFSASTFFLVSPRSDSGATTSGCRCA